jgi:hypothetical protein
MTSPLNIRGKFIVVYVSQNWRYIPVKLSHNVGTHKIDILDLHHGNPFEWPQGIYVQVTDQPTEWKHYILVTKEGTRKIAMYFNHSYPFPGVCDIKYPYTPFIKLPEGTTFIAEVGTK